VTETPILRRGAGGPAVFALREHLRLLGHRFGSERDFGERTEAAVREFQTSRGLRSDGICGPQTWAALQSAGWGLGARIIALRHPNLRGDDVAALQHRLSALGFDPGRPDGIFGPDSETALREFQRSAGIASDGVCGPATIAALDRLDALAGGSIVEVREREMLADAPRTIADRRVAISAAPGLRDLGTTIGQRLVDLGVEVLLLLGDDPARAGRAANDFEADLLVALVDPDPEVRVAYFATDRFKSVGGLHHGEHLANELGRLTQPSRPVGRTYEILRATAMHAVAIHIAEAEATDAFADAIVAGIRHGFEATPRP
jgi:N-acetylmuramoyl-L-alanine amidase